MIHANTNKISFMKTILITGTAGFIGSAVASALLKRGDVVLGLDDFNDSTDPRLKESRIRALCDSPNFILYRNDIRDARALATIAQQHRIDQICHLAARAGVRASLELPFLYTDVNIRGTLTIFEFAKKYSIPDVVFASSSSVYGNRSAVPFAESDAVDHPVSTYAATKKTTELLAYTYHHLYKIRATGLRYFTVYGPWGRPDMAPMLFSDAIMRGQPITVFHHGKTLRDFTFIDDIVAGTIAALDRRLPFEIINLGNAHPIELMDFIHALEVSVKKKAIINFAPLPASDVLVTAADTTKARQLLGFQAKTAINEGVPRFVAWFKKYFQY